MCGVIGIFSPGRDVFPDLVAGLFQMQHRGQDACGIALSDGARIRLHRAMGHVREVFAAPPDGDFAGFVGCGHVRYPTQGGNRPSNTQPHLVITLDGPIFALCSNGDITNYHALRKELEDEGIDFQGTNDGELLLRFIARHVVRGGRSVLEAIRLLQERAQGAYSACLMTRDRLFAIRDPHAIRPFCVGHADGTWVVASETVALDICRVDLVSEIDPGEVVEIGPEGMQRHPHPDPSRARGGRTSPAHCVFEHVYFSRPDSLAFGLRVYEVRKRIGAWLAQHAPIDADVVVPVPDSSDAVALGYAQGSRLPFEFGLIRNHYVGRTFISADQSLRDGGVKMKFNPQRSVLQGRRVVLVDDSIVRGTTLRKIVRMVRGAGATAVHLRIGSPVTRFPCFYGVDTPDPAQLIGNRLDAEGIRMHLEADSLAYMSVAGLREAVGNEDRFCMACFDGSYPVALHEQKLHK